MLTEAVEIVGRKYEVMDVIGEGAFGTVHKGKNIYTAEFVAIKRETIDKTSVSVLKNEVCICKHLQGGKGIAKIKWYGKSCSCLNAVFELLGESLDHRKKMLHTFSLTCASQIALQILDRLEFVHNKGFVHRDVKPDNFIFGIKDPNLLYIIDFGLSKQYIGSNGEHVTNSQNQRMIGTPRYASLHVHNKQRYSRRDDLISLGYMLVYFIKGVLPWQGIATNTIDDKLYQIQRLKSETNIDDLCDCVPIELTLYLHYCYNLEFQETPKYDVLKKLFLKLLEKHDKTCETPISVAY